MLHYRKGENIEEEIKKDNLPFDDCMPKGQKDFLWMHVKGGTKVGNVISYAKNALDKGEYRTVVWTGAGGGVVKTVSCAEILKRSYPLYQVTRIGSVLNEEHWIPQMEGLDELVVNRQIPCLHILMSLDEISDSVGGVQKPNTSTDFFDQYNIKSTGNRYNYGSNNNRGNRGGNQGRGEQRFQKKSKPQNQQKDNEQNNQQNIQINNEQIASNNKKTNNGNKVKRFKTPNPNKENSKSTQKSSRQQSGSLVSQGPNQSQSNNVQTMEM